MRSEKTFLARVLPTTSSQTTRLHPSLFSDLTFAVAFENFFRSSVQPSLAPLPPDIRWEKAKQRISTFAAQFSRERYRAKEDRRRSLEEQLKELENVDEFTASLSPRWLSLQQSLQNLDKEDLDTLLLRTSNPLYPNSQSNFRILRQKLATRRSESTFKLLRLSDDSKTNDIQTALSYTHTHFSQQFTPSSRDSFEVARLRKEFLLPIFSSSPLSDPRFARRWDPAEAQKLSRPITPEEVTEAIASAPSSSSPGLLGLPYEFYKQNSLILATELAEAYNAAWERGVLPPSQTEARVRLLFKNTKKNADPSLLSHYRPISLRETDYRLLARILVKRLNPLLEKSIPRNQVGFVPGRDSSQAGLHLQLLVEEIQKLDLPRAALLSLDQEKAYDLVDHEWILASYEAFGAPSRFLSLLTSLYDSQRLVARYNINGYFTDPVPLRCGLPQGCPLSCASWLISFQPFLDSLLRDKITLTLPSPISSTRPDIITHLAFADDSILAVESLSNSIPKLALLADRWKLATNGRLNTSKTEAFALGQDARSDPISPLMNWIDESFKKWAGFPIALEPQPQAFYSFLLESIRKKCNNAIELYGSLHTRALYANSHILSQSLHSLSFYPAPHNFLVSLRSTIVNFVWGSFHQHKNKHTVKMEILFLPVKKGGLGLIDPFSINEANNLRRLNYLLSDTNSLSHDLLLSSFRRHAPNLSHPNPAYSRNPWSLFRRSRLHFSHPFWQFLSSTASTVPPETLRFTHLSTPQILALPPSLFFSHPVLNSFDMTAELYARGQQPPATLPPAYGSLATRVRGLGNARIVWQNFVESQPLLRSCLPSPSVPSLLPPPDPPGPLSFYFFDLPPTFSASQARSKLENFRPAARLDPILSRVFPSLPSSDALIKRTWRWIHSPPATARESETHWKILHNGILTRSQLSHFAEGAVRSCIFCSSDPDDVVHALFECEYSKEYWKSLLHHLGELSQGILNATTFSADEVLLGLPTLRSVADDQTLPRLRAIVAVAIQTLVDARWSRIKLNPSLSSPLPQDLALKAITSYKHRLS